MDIIPETYTDIYSKGYDCGLQIGKLENNSWDRDFDYLKWHFWNDGFFDGYRIRLKNLRED